MATYQYKAGLHNVGSYQVSGAPFVTGSVMANVAVEVRFPRVTKFVTVANYGTSSVKVGFSENGMSALTDGDGFYPHNRYIRVPSPGSQFRRNHIQTFEIKCVSIWLSGSHSVDILAGLTGLHTPTINNPGVSPSGSNWSGSLAAQV